MAALAATGASGALWWVAVGLSDDVRGWTLGGWPAGWLAIPDLTLFVGASLWAALRRSWRWAVVAAAWSCAVTVVLVGFALATGKAGWGGVGMVAASALLVVAAATLRRGALPTHWFFRGPFRFAVAPERSGRAHLRRSLGQLVVFWITLFGVVPVVLAVGEHRMAIRAPGLDRTDVRVVGIVLFVLGSAVALWACVTMATVGNGTPLPAATARTLVVRGPYRFVRNPMAAIGAVQVVAVGLVLGAWTVIAVALVGAVLWDVLIRPEEEADLARRFGPAYDGYARDVRCWLPTISPR